jgi:hypothetical protein
VARLRDRQRMETIGVDIDRTMYNQKELGVLSHRTLRRLVEGGGLEQQLLPLPLCS